LATIDSTVKLAAEVTVTLTEEQRRQRARQAILEAFSERPPLVVDSACKIVTGKEVWTADEQAYGSPPEEREG
jgi:hypothetical protein